MNARRNILKITGILIVISFILIWITPINTKINNILIGIFGSSLLAALVELPNIISEKQKLKNNLYANSLYLYMTLQQYKWWINNAEETNQIIQEDFNSNFEVAIGNYARNIGFLDDEMFYNKDKMKILDELKNNINKVVNIFYDFRLKFKIKCINIRIETMNPNFQIPAEKLNDEFNNWKKVCDEYISYLQEKIPLLLDRKQKKQWKIDIGKIVESLDKNETKE